MDFIPEPQSVSLAGRLQIIQYTKRELKELLANGPFWLQPELPITKRRVLSHISNPRADDNDTVLITAFTKGLLVAYLGILPDLLMNDGQAPVKFGWLTTWWVDKDSEHRLAAMTILFSAMKKYSNRIAISSFSDEAKRAYDATRRFQEFARFDRSYFILALPPSFRVLSPLMRRVIAAKNHMILGRKLSSRGLEVRTVDSFDSALESFINARTVGDPLARDGSCWKWILRFPWISTSAEDEAAQNRYAFSAFAKEFRQIPTLVVRHGSAIAFLVTTLREGRLSLKYAYYDSRDVADVAAALRLVIAEVKPWLFISADTALNTELKRGLPFYLAVRSKSMVAYAAKEFACSVGTPRQMGIGDNIFT